MCTNLFSGPDIRIETESPIRLVGNFSGEVSQYFRDIGRDLHLNGSTRERARQVPRLPEAMEDFDRHQRSPVTHVGARRTRGPQLIRALVASPSAVLGLLFGREASYRQEASDAGEGCGCERDEGTPSLNNRRLGSLLRRRLPELSAGGLGQASDSNTFSS